MIIRTHFKTSFYCERSSKRVQKCLGFFVGGALSLLGLSACSGIQDVQDPKRLKAQQDMAAATKMGSRSSTLAQNAGSQTQHDHGGGAPFSCYLEDGTWSMHFDSGELKLAPMTASTEESEDDDGHDHDHDHEHSRIQSQRFARLDVDAKILAQAKTDEPDTAHAGWSLEKLLTFSGASELIFDPLDVTQAPFGAWQAQLSVRGMSREQLMEHELIPLTVRVSLAQEKSGGALTLGMLLFERKTRKNRWCQVSGAYTSPHQHDGHWEIVLKHADGKDYSSEPTSEKADDSHDGHAH